MLKGACSTASLNQYTMVDMRIDNISEITLYLKECYGCERDNKFHPLRQFILRNQFKLDTLVIKRIVLNPKWRQEAEALRKELPAIAVKRSNGKIEVMSYSEFLEKYELINKPKKKRESAIEDNDGTGKEEKVE